MFIILLLELNMKMQASVQNNRSASTITGIFFIIATVSAIIGSKLYDPLLREPNYLIEGARNANRIVGGALSELITCCANIGTAIMMYPYLRKFNESIGIGYVCFRFLEVVFIAIGVVGILTLLTVSQSLACGSIEVSQAKFIGETLKAIYGWTFLFGPNFILGINTFLYSYAFYKTGLVPKSLAIFGLIGAIMIFVSGLLQMFGIVVPLSVGHLIMVLPIAMFEMVLAVRLILSGFDLRTSDS